MRIQSSLFGALTPPAFHPVGANRQDVLFHFHPKEKSFLTYDSRSFIEEANRLDIQIQCSTNPWRIFHALDEQLLLYWLIFGETNFLCSWGIQLCGIDSIDIEIASCIVKEGEAKEQRQVESSVR